VNGEPCLPVVLCIPERQTEQARRLIRYCWDLDRTEIWLIIMTRDDDDSFVAQFPANRFHSLQSYGLHRAAVEVGGSFIWLEADASPLQADWAWILSEEYERCGKKFLLSSDSHPPFDLIGGIGCYPKETEWLVPYQFEKSGWDLWLVEAVPHLIARTPLLQHSYCIYGANGFCKGEHRFPRDNEILRKEAVLFHRDPYQDLLENPVKQNF
jgi:hypothetical protein